MSKKINNILAMPPQAMICGANPVCQALGQVCELIGLELIKEAKYNDSVDILIMSDGEDTCRLPKVSIFSGNEKLIYIESNNKNTTKHTLFYLTYLLPTYRIPLEQFSIVELARVIEDMTGDSE